jgi:hypothetical protein
MDSEVDKKCNCNAKKAAKLWRASIALYELLCTLSPEESEFIDAILYDERKFFFPKISGNGTSGVREAAYELLILFSLATGKPHPGETYEVRQSRQRGKRTGTKENPIFQNFVCALLLLPKWSADG